MDSPVHSFHVFSLSLLVSETHRRKWQQLQRTSSCGLLCGSFTAQMGSYIYKDMYEVWWSYRNSLHVLCICLTSEYKSGFSLHLFGLNHRALGKPLKLFPLLDGLATSAGKLV